MAGTRARDVGTLAPRRGFRHLALHIHRLLPVHPVAIANQHGDGRAGSATVTDAGKNLRAVAFDRHPPATAVAGLAAPQLRVERVDIDVEPRRHAVQRDDERLAVRFTSAEKPQHSEEIVYEEIATSGRPHAILRRFSPRRLACMWGAAWCDLMATQI